MALALCTLRAPTSYDGAAPIDLLVDGLNSGVVRDSQAIITVTVDDSISAVVVPDPTTIGTATPKHVSALEVWVNGTQIDPGDLHDGVSVTRSLDRAIQTASFGVLAGVLGNPFTRNSPPPCNKEIDIYGVYQTSSGVKRLPILVGGVVDSFGIEDTGFEIVERYAIVDRGGRVQREAVTFVLPQGHGLRRDRVAEKVLVDQAGQSSANVAFQVSRVMNKGLQLIDADPVSALQAIFDAEYRQLLWSPDGKADNPRRRALDSAGSAMTITGEHIIREAGLGFTGSGDAITRLTLTTTKQIVRSEEDACGLRTEILETVHNQAFEVEWTAYTQGNGPCSIAAHATVPTITATLQPVQRIVVTRTFNCDTLILEKTETYRWYNRTRARYQYDQSAPSAWECLVSGGQGPFLHSDAVAGPADTVPAFADRYQTWRKLSEETIAHYYDKAGYYGPLISQGAAQAYGVFFTEAPFVAAAPHTVGGVTVQLRSEIEGSKLGTIRTLKTWHQRRNAIKTRAAHSTAWDSVDITDNLYGLAEKDGVPDADIIEQFRITEIDYEILEPDGDGLLKRRAVISERYAARPGAGNLYADGTESRDLTETFVVAGMADETYMATDEKYHKVIITETGVDGKVINITSEDRVGGGPAIERLPGADPSETAFLSADELAEFNTREISTEETQTVVVEIDASALEDCYLKRKASTTLPYAENETELQEVGELLVSESYSFRLRVPMLLNCILKEGDKVHITVSLPIDGGSYEIDHDATVKSLTHSWTGQPRDPALTGLDLMLHHA